jgi:hypothetical protein
MWAQAIATAIGIWLAAAPEVLGYGGAAKLNDQIAGPLIATFGLIAIWEVTRGLRWLNVLPGAWLILAPWVLGYVQTPLVHSLILGGLLFGASLVRGKITNRFGGGWSSLWRGEPLERSRAGAVG